MNIAVEVVEWTLRQTGRGCSVCNTATILAKIRRPPEYIWVWAEACRKCKAILGVVSCPDAVEGGQDAKSVGRWLAHLREHGWRDQDFDLQWIKRAGIYKRDTVVHEED